MNEQLELFYDDPETFYVLDSIIRGMDLMGIMEEGNFTKLAILEDYPPSPTSIGENLLTVRLHTYKPRAEREEYDLCIWELKGSAPRYPKYANITWHDKKEWP